MSAKVQDGPATGGFDAYLSPPPSPHRRDADVNDAAMVELAEPARAPPAAMEASDALHVLDVMASPPDVTDVNTFGESVLNMFSPSLSPASKDLLTQMETAPLDGPPASPVETASVAGSSIETPEVSRSLSRSLSSQQHTARGGDSPQTNEAANVIDERGRRQVAAAQASQLRRDEKKADRLGVAVPAVGSPTAVIVNGAKVLVPSTPPRDMVPADQEQSPISRTLSAKERAQRMKEKRDARGGSRGNVEAVPQTKDDDDADDGDDEPLFKAPSPRVGDPIAGAIDVGATPTWSESSAGEVAKCSNADGLTPLKERQALLADQKRAHAQSMALMKKTQQAELDDTTEAHTQALEAVRKAHVKTLSETKRGHDKEVKAETMLAAEAQAHDVALAEQKAAQVAELKRLNDEHDATKEAAAAAAQTEVESAKVAEAAAVAAQAVAAQVTEELKGSEAAERAKVFGEQQRLAKISEAARAKNEQELVAEQTKAQAALAALETEHAGQVASVKAEHLAKIQKIAADAAGAQASVSAEQLQAMLDSHESELSAALARTTDVCVECCLVCIYMPAIDRPLSDCRYTKRKSPSARARARRRWRTLSRRTRPRGRRSRRRMNKLYGSRRLSTMRCWPKV